MASRAPNSTPASRAATALPGLDDAVPPAGDASYERAAAAPQATERERAIVSVQLGRPARGRSAIVHRCGFGLPTVIRVDPRLPDGTPFPTVFWQTCPALKSALGTQESDGTMAGMRERIGSDPALQEELAGAHERYVAFRDALAEPLRGAPGAGGMPHGVKCLHVMAAHELATGDNPIGREAVERATPVACPRPCVDERAIAEARAELPPLEG